MTEQSKSANRKSGSEIIVTIDGISLSGQKRLPVGSIHNARVPLIIALHGGTYSSTYFDVPDYSLLDKAEALGIPIIALDRPSYENSTALPHAETTIPRNCFIKTQFKAHQCLPKLLWPWLKLLWCTAQPLPVYLRCDRTILLSKSGQARQLVRTKSAPKSDEEHRVVSRDPLVLWIRGNQGSQFEPQPFRYLDQQLKLNGARLLLGGVVGRPYALEHP